MDRVFIQQLKVDAIIGVFPWERKLRQPLFLDLEMAWDNRVPAISGKLEDALDYGAVSARVEEFVNASSYELLETLAEELVKTLQAEFGIPWLRVSITKPGAVKEAAGVGIVIERGVSN